MATIQGIYLALFGRPADPAGLAYYNGVTGNGADLSGIGNLAGQKEYLDRFSGMSSTQIVQSIYQSLFGRAGEQTGIDFWVGRLTSGALSINNIAIAILDGATGSDKATVDAKIAAADLFTSHLDLPAEQKAYDASTVGRARDYIAAIDASHPGTASAVDALIAQNQASAGQGPASGTDSGNGGSGSGSSSPGGAGGTGGQGSVFILTGPDAGITGHDVIVGTAGDDAIYAIDPKSITSNDIIHGGAGNDTLYIRPQAAALIANAFSPFIDGVETVHNGNGDFLAFDLSHVTGVNTLWSDTDTYYQYADVQTVFGLGNGSTNIFFASDLSGGDTLLKLALNTNVTSAVNSDFQGRGIEHASLDILPTNFGTVEFGRDMVGLTEIDVTGAGKGGIAFDQSGGLISIFDASGNQGGVTADISASNVLKTVTGGSGSDTLTLSASNGGGYSVTTGAGSDTLKFGINIAQFHIAVDPVGITDATPQALDSAMITVTDFDSAHDTLVLTGVSYMLSGGQQGDVSSSASLWAAANLAASYAHAASATDKLVSFHYAGDTYVYNDGDSNGAISMGDGIIKLAGVATDLTDLNYQHG